MHRNFKATWDANGVKHHSPGQNPGKPEHQSIATHPNGVQHSRCSIPGLYPGLGCGTLSGCRTVVAFGEL